MTSSEHTRQNRLSALLDLILIIGVLVGLKSLLLNFDAIWSYAGPISLLAALATATWRLRANNEKWSDIGLGRPTSIVRTVLWTILALVLTIVAGILAQSLATSLIGGPDAATQAIDARYQDRFANLPGNLPVFLFWLATAWIVGGFTEEMLFRAAMVSRFERLFAKIPFAALFAVICQAILFGQQHYYYQGLAGWAATGAIAFVSGVLYLAFNRNLWPLIVSHGLSNTLGLTLLYLGLQP